VTSSLRACPVLRMAAVSALAMLATLVLAASPAAAETRIVAEAGVDGRYVPGEAIPVHVEVHADQLVSGELRITTRDEMGMGFESSEVVVPVEVPGGSVKSYRFLVSDSLWQLPRFTVRLIDGDRTLARDTVSLNHDVADELVGLLPAMSDAVDAPERTDLLAAEGVARYATLDPAWLDLGREGLGLLGTIVALDADLAALSDRQRDELLHWVHTGGTLVVDDRAENPVSALPDDAQPVDGSHVRVGAGLVRLGDGAARAGGWEDLIYPTPATAAGQDGDAMNMGMGGGGAMPVLATLSSDAGFRLPAGGSLVLLLGAYLLLAGPGAYFLLRSMRRATLAWLVLPALAGVFTAVVYVQG
jgi:hypothetical protein